MASYAGAVAAMRARFTANFSLAPVEYPNEKPPALIWPPTNAPWCFFEVVQTLSEIRGAGLPGNQTWLTIGHIFIHVFAPKGFGLPEHQAVAEAAGEVFRAKTFYTVDANTKVLCMAPTIRGGDSESDDGNQFGLVVAIPFEFYFTA